MGKNQPNLLLKKAREGLGYTQQEVADLVGASKNTYQRWETGETFPQPPFRRRLCQALKASMAELGLVAGNAETPSGTIELNDTSEYREEQNEYLQTNLGSRLLGIVDVETYADQRKEFARVMEQFDAMNTENQDYAITRRQAVISLATFPFAPPLNLAKRERVASSDYALFVRECGASLTACEVLARSSDPLQERNKFIICVITSGVVGIGSKIESFPLWSNTKHLSPSSSSSLAQLPPAKAD